LAISQRIIQSHGGRIEVNNILPKGTQFSILLPV
jgi:signal transduction histidine kinase